MFWVWFGHFMLGSTVVRRLVDAVGIRGRAFGIEHAVHHELLIPSQVAIKGELEVSSKLKMSWVDPH
jgi:hypothetical protein